MFDEKFIESAIQIYHKMPEGYWEQFCRELVSARENKTLNEVLSSMPQNVNHDAHLMVINFLEYMTPFCTWAELGRQLWTIGQLCKRHENSGQVEIVWSGPETAFLSYRRTDQVLYDLINNAEKNILLVTFAASRIKLLNEALVSALNRGVSVRLVLEFEEESEGQLSKNSLDAFFPEVVEKSTIYYWPKEKREVNQAKKPGKLHAKSAVVDDNALIYSANLTDDAFNRNMELGALFMGGETPGKILTHFEFLIKAKVLVEYDG